MTTIEILSEDTGIIHLYKDFEVKKDPFDELQVELFRRETITLFGKEYLQPRLIRFEGDDGVSYKYSKKVYEAEPWSEFSLYLLRKLSLVCDVEFNSVLINWYRDGQDSMGLHADNEPELGKDPTIASVSFGAERKMRFRHNESKEKLDVDLPSGSLLLMSGSLQHHWKHEIPKTKKQIGPRMNFTFRKIL